ncbi:MAG: DUF4276 family protein [Thermodesulfobacteriota bacterium]
MVSLVPIVEGQGEVEAVPVLLRRILSEMAVYDVAITRPFRVKRNRVVREGEIERAIRLAISDRSQVGGVLVILDADDDCPAALGPDLLKRCRAVVPSLPVAVVLAHREFESWFLGAKESLRGRRGIRDDAVNPDNPETIRGAKECLTQNMNDSRYLPTDDQPAFAEDMDLGMARENCPSFEKLARDVASLIDKMKK